MVTKSGKGKKPRCGKGQSCGMTCIEARDTCSERLTSADVKRLGFQLIYTVTTSAQKLTEESGSASDSGKTYDQLDAKYPNKGTALNSTLTDLGNGVSRWNITIPSVDGSEDKLTYSVIDVKDKDGNVRSFTVSDGFIKEVTAVKSGAKWDEARQAAIRSKASEPAREVPKSEAKVRATKPRVTKVEPTKPPAVKPYSVSKVLGNGAYGEAVVTERGTIVKTLALDEGLWGKSGVKSFNLSKVAAKEYSNLEVGYKAEVMPKPLGLTDKSIEMEQASGEPLHWEKFPYLEQKIKPAQKSIDAVLKLHNLGYVHGDAHAGNVLYDKANDKVTLIDAGLMGKVGDARPGFKKGEIDSYVLTSGVNDVTRLLDNMMLWEESQNLQKDFKKYVESKGSTIPKRMKPEDIKAIHQQWLDYVTEDPSRVSVEALVAKRKNSN